MLLFSLASCTDVQLIRTYVFVLHEHGYGYDEI